ncbi:UPF0029-domain-containing protein [Metschnikowia bicuspidata var. bicuspidata NRRL YB-4993]|uniref:UPF0029-domain-containing protein n=1 Tax=Metschnikowia bicuspidata var. bicuspidata NRRL YB-4993 TaxID=869754 RepID=A0A1A0HCR9_9ASCO|nr:UPF0029-domain-containing protein [Metschnikowia bicuspidata var. bicuspidata NRRL YB-4993]OBA21713.1 UPF0029-domain-containing protein [Metschnikowia bicuspidata var. bicuspidata NRRL YB-4993]
MPYTELNEELDAIEAIYPGSTEKLGPGIVLLTVPDFSDISIQLVFPESYPVEKPSMIQALTKNVRKYPDLKYIENKINELIDSVFMEEMVIIFELLGEIQTFLEAYDEEHARELQEIEAPGSPEPRLTKERDYTAEWIQSDPIVDRNSSFIAYAREAHSVEEANKYIDDLKNDRKIAKATHNMTSMRIKGTNGTSFQDCDDDGETAAGLRMLHLMTIMDVWNVVVVVSRWYGGTHLGPDRFKHINTATRDVLIKGGFFLESDKKKK